MSLRLFRLYFLFSVQRVSDPVMIRLELSFCCDFFHLFVIYLLFIYL